MIAITVTQEVKDQNELTESVGSIKTYNTYPNKFWVTERMVGGYNQSTPELDALHIADGFREVVQPTYDQATQIRGAIFFDAGNDYFTYTVIDKTDEQIQSELIVKSEGRKQEIIQADIVSSAEASAQTSDDDTSLDNQDLFPMWSGDSNEYALDYKVQDFTVDNVLALYKVVQAHTSQPTWIPRDTPALFTRIQLDVVLEWVQPSGAQDAYNIGDRVWFGVETDVYESTVDANVFAPLVVAGQWILI
jgi:hypothetical protein